MIKCEQIELCEENQERLFHAHAKCHIKYKVGFVCGVY